MNNQESFWSGNQGKSYLQRNFNIGSRPKDRKEFYDMFQDIEDKNISILEAGCNCAINLQILKKMGFTNLSGIDIGPDALEEARRRLPDCDFYQGSILNMPFKDGQFDLVFTSGVLIHQHPENSLQHAVSEIYRCSNKYILGLEDYNDSFESRSYINRGDLYWSGPYDSKYKSSFKDLQLLRDGLIQAEGHPTLKRKYFAFQK